MLIPPQAQETQEWENESLITTFQPYLFLFMRVQFLIGPQV